MARVISKRFRETRVGRAGDGSPAMKPGFDVEFGTRDEDGRYPHVYTFAPTEGDPNTLSCEVDNDEHLAAFAAIPEGYEVVPATKKDATKEEKQSQEKKISAAKEAGAVIKTKREQAAINEQKRLDKAAEIKRRRAKMNRGGIADNAENFGAGPI